MSDIGGGVREEMSCPEVSGVSPKEGVPGTKVTIRGQNLGNSKEDIECEPFVMANTMLLFYFSLC